MLDGARRSFTVCAFALVAGCTTEITNTNTIVPSNLPDARLPDAQLAPDAPPRLPDAPPPPDVPPLLPDAPPPPDVPPLLPDASSPPDAMPAIDAPILAIDAPVPDAPEPDAPTSPDAALICGGADLQTSDSNCGQCGYACLHGRSWVEGRCTPAWLPLSMTNEPTPRTRSGAVSFGGKYVLTGGVIGVFFGPATATGISYDPDSDTWGSFPSQNTARASHIAVATTDSIYVFAGLTDTTAGSNIGPGLEIFNGSSWTSVVASGQPHGRYDFAAVWTGTEVFIFGGADDQGPATSTGALFDPTGPSWIDASCPLNGCERSFEGAFLDGNLVRVWGGGPYGNAPAGLTYDLVGGAWSSWSVPPNTPSGLYQYADDGRRIYFLQAPSADCPSTPSVVIFDRTTASWSAPDTSAVPAGVTASTGTDDPTNQSGSPMGWVAGEIFAWSGSCGDGGPIAGGGRYQPAAPSP